MTDKTRIEAGKADASQKIVVLVSPQGSTVTVDAIMADVFTAAGYKTLKSK